MSTERRFENLERRVKALETPIASLGGNRTERTVYVGPGETLTVWVGPPGHRRQLEIRWGREARMPEIFGDEVMQPWEAWEPLREGSDR